MYTKEDSLILNAKNNLKQIPLKPGKNPENLKMIDPEDLKFLYKNVNENLNILKLIALKAWNANKLFVLQPRFPENNVT